MLIPVLACWAWGSKAIALGSVRHLERFNLRRRELTAAFRVRQTLQATLVRCCLRLFFTEPVSGFGASAGDRDSAGKRGLRAFRSIARRQLEDTIWYVRLEGEECPLSDQTLNSMGLMLPAWFHSLSLGDGAARHKRGTGACSARCWLVAAIPSYTIHFSNTLLSLSHLAKNPEARTQQSRNIVSMSDQFNNGATNAAPRLPTLLPRPAAVATAPSGGARRDSEIPVPQRKRRPVTAACEECRKRKIKVWSIKVFAILTVSPHLLMKKRYLMPSARSGTGSFWA